MAAYGVAYWFLITDRPTADTHKKARSAGALEVSTWADLLLYCLFIIPYSLFLYTGSYRY